MVRLTIKSILARKFRVVATSLAVLLGVAFLAGTLMLTDTIGRAFDDLFSTVNENTDAVVRSSQVVEGEFQDTRSRVDESLVDEVRAVDGVQDASGWVSGFAQIVGSDGDVVGNPGQGPPVIGGNWEDNEVNPFDLVTFEGNESRSPEGPGEVVIDRGTAEEGDLGIGDTTTVLTSQGVIPVEIVGVASFGGADSPGGASFTLFETEYAQEVLGQPGRFDQVDVVAAEGISEEEIQSRLQTELDGEAELEVLTGAEITEEQQDQLAEALSFFNTFLIAFAVIAIFVGAFIIYNTFGILVAQRVREMALMRALGASRRQVRNAVLAEAIAVGFVASILGIIAGYLLAIGLEALIGAFGVDLPSTTTVILPRTIIVSIVVGVVVAVISALIPARRAGLVPPVAAMRDVAIDTSGTSRPRVIIGSVVLVLGIAALLFGLFGDVDNAFLLVAVGAGLVFIGVAMLAPLFTRPVARVIGGPIEMARGITGSLARKNATRNPTRTATTAAALMIGVGLVATIAIMASSIRASVEEIIEESFTGDLVAVAGTGFGGTGVSPELTAALAELPEVQAAAGIRFGEAEIDGESQFLSSGDAEQVAQVFDVGVIEGSLEDLGPTDVAIHTDEADSRDLGIGDTLTMRFAETGEQDFTVAVIYSENELADDFFIDREAFDANFTDVLDFQVFIDAAEGVSIEEARAAVESAAAAYPNVEVQDLGEYKETQTAPITQLLNLIFILLALAILIAVIGIINTLLLSITERTHELGMLRAVGMSRRQLRAVVRGESVIIAILGTFLGLAIGVFFGWAIVQSFSDDGLNVFRIPVGTLVVVVILAVIVGVLAAWWPARKAGRMNVLQAIAYE